MAQFTLLKDALGQYRWHYKAANGKILADSAEGYINKADALVGLKHLQKYGRGASIVDRTRKLNDY